MSMKKKYYAPHFRVVDCVCEQMIAASNEQLNNGGVIPTSTKERKSNWGNIWND